MAPSFSAATRQLDDGYEYNEYALSTSRARTDAVGSNVEPMGFARNVVDYSQVNDEIPDQYSYDISYSRSHYHVHTAPRRSEHPKRYNDDTIRLVDVSQRGRLQNVSPEWDGKDFALSPVQEQHPQDNPGKTSFVYKHVPNYGMYRGTEHGQDDFSYRSSTRLEVQPGFQRIHYDAKLDIKPKSRPTMIEVSPGEFLRLRGADETWKAIHNDFYVPGVCVMCDMTLFCIQDAIFILCPECLIVSPLEGVVYDGYDGGVGMGFTMENLAIWQEEIRSEGNRGENRMLRST